jgi:colanic acid biosynthesis glycosyl transferase WcaI
MKKRVLLLTQWFDPEPTFKGMAFARELVAQGFEVEVITGFPNYPGGKIYPGYQLKLLQREQIDGVQITRVPLYPSHDGSAIKRILNYVTFALSALVYGLFGAKKADVMYAYQPPLTVGITAALIRLLKGVPVVYDIQDMWPDTLRATGMVSNENVLAIVGKVSQWVYAKVDRIVVLSPGFKHLLIERGVPEQKIEIIYNWCDETLLNAPVGGVPPEFPSTDYFNILFAGTMGKAQALDAVMAAAELLQVQKPEIRFVFVGGGVEVERLKTLIIDRKIDNVVFIPRVPMNQVGAMLQAADALLVHLKNDPLFAITIPSKIQAYLSVGKPVLMAVPGDAAALVEGAQCGIVAISENAESIADSAISLVNIPNTELQAMGKRGQEFYQQEMSLAVGVKSFARAFESLL